MGTAAWTVGDREVLGLASVAMSSSCIGASASSVLRLAAVDMRIEYAHDRSAIQVFPDANGSSDGVVLRSTVSGDATESDQTQ